MEQHFPFSKLRKLSHRFQWLLRTLGTKCQECDKIYYRQLRFCNIFFFQRFQENNKTSFGWMRSNKLLKSIHLVTTKTRFLQYKRKKNERCYLPRAHAERENRGSFHVDRKESIMPSLKSYYRIYPKYCNT